MALDRAVEQRRRDGLLGGEHRAVLAHAHADAEDCVAGLEHGGADVGEVEVDQAGQHDQVRDPLDRLTQHVVGDAEGVGHRGAAPRIWSRRSLGTTIRASTSAPRARCPPPPGRRGARPRTRTACHGGDGERAHVARELTTGAAPVPVPPPAPAARKTMSDPFRSCLILSGAVADTGSEPDPRPLVSRSRCAG